MIGDLRRWLPWIAPLLYFLLAGAVYWEAQENQGLPEDDRVVWANAAVTGEGIGGAALGRYYEDRSEYHDAVRPLATAVNRLRFDAFGADRAGFLWIQIGLHSLAAVLLAVAIARTTGMQVFGLLAGLVFVVHPVLSSSVLRLAGVSEILGLLFGLASILAVGWTLRAEGTALPRGRLAVTLGTLLAALAAKEASFLFAPVLLLFAWAGRGDPRHPNRTPTIVALILGTLVMCAAALVHRMVAFALLPEAAEVASAVHPDSGVSFVQRSWIGLEGVWHHLRLLVLPQNLAYSYDFLGLEGARDAGGNARALGGAIVLIAALGAAIVASIRRRPAATVWLGAFAFSLLAALGIVAPVGDFLNERSMYYLVPGSLGVLGLGWAWIRSKVPAGWVDAAGTLACVAAVGALAFGTVGRADDYKNQETLIRAQLRDHPSSAWARYDLGNFYLSRGQYAAAREQYEGALERNPELWMAWINLGAAYSRETDYSLAMRAYDRALQGAADLPEYRVPVAKARFNRAILLMRQNRNDEAAQDLERTLEVLPDHLRAHANLGLIYRNSDKYDEQALFHLRRAIELETDRERAQQLEESIDYIHQRREAIEQRRQLRINAGQLPDEEPEDVGEDPEP